MIPAAIGQRLRAQRRERSQQVGTDQPVVENDGDVTLGCLEPGQRLWLFRTSGEKTERQLDLFGGAEPMEIDCLLAPKSVVTVSSRVEGVVE